MSDLGTTCSALLAFLNGALAVALLAKVGFGRAATAEEVEQNELPFGAGVRKALRCIGSHPDCKTERAIIGGVAGAGALLAVWAGASLAARGWAAVAIAAVLHLPALAFVAALHLQRRHNCLRGLRRSSLLPFDHLHAEI